MLKAPRPHDVRRITTPLRHWTKYADDLWLGLNRYEEDLVATMNSAQRCDAKKLIEDLILLGVTQHHLNGLVSAVRNAEGGDIEGSESPGISEAYSITVRDGQQAITDALKSCWR